MGLLKPTPGEVADRISILNLKIEHCPDEKDDVKLSFIEEKGDLECYAIDTFPVLPDSRYTYTVQLGRINEKLWDLEDLVRAFDPKNGALSILLDYYRKITELNDKRQGLIKKINARYGIKKVEKLYKEEKEND